MKTHRRTKLKALSLILWCIGVQLNNAISQVSITGTAPLTITFDATFPGVNEGQFNGIGFQSAPNSGQIDSDAFASTGMSDGSLPFGGSGPGNDYSRGTSNGGVVNGGFYAFNTGGGDYALGFQPSVADFTPGTLTLRLQNISGTFLTGFDFSYQLKSYNDENRATSVTFSHSPDNVTFSPEPTLDFTSQMNADAPPTWQTNTFAIAINGLNVPNNGYYFLRWTSFDAGGSGSRDEFAIDNITFGNMALPVELNHFMVEQHGANAILSWQTASEYNNHYFEIERSTDGITYEIIATLDGAGNSLVQTDYEYTDTAPHAGQNYYRLNQVDFDGQSSQSRIVSLFIGKSGSSFSKVVPTFVQDEATIFFLEPQDEKVHVQIFDLAGQLKVEAFAEPHAKELPIRLQYLPTGIYIAMLRAGKLTNTHRINKQF